MDGIKMKGEYWVEHVDVDGKILSRQRVKNGVTNEGINKLLDVMFHAVTQITTWYFGLIDNASFSALAAGDVMNSHAGWIENQDYDESVRQTWPEDAAASKQISNTTLVTFTMSATKTIKGIFVTSVNTKGGTTGTLWSTALFDSAIDVVDNQLIRFVYTISAS